MPEGFSTHQDYMAEVKSAADDRQTKVEAKLAEGFARFLQPRHIPVINFKDVNAEELGVLFETYPIIVKAVIMACNVAARAIERDLGIKNFDTYHPRFKPGQALTLARYVKPFLPVTLPVQALSHLDRVAYIDKEMRKGKGNWERKICEAANHLFPRKKFRKTTFTTGTDVYELDAAACAAPNVIEIGIDVKRVEAKQDTHKRSDEIVNKAAKFKSVYPNGKFGAVVSFPFPAAQAALVSRLQCPNIDGLVFANDDEGVIRSAVEELLRKIGFATVSPRRRPQ
jgi:hypothetical protein